MNAQTESMRRKRPRVESNDRTRSTIAKRKTKTRRAQRALKSAGR